MDALTLTDDKELWETMKAGLTHHTTEAHGHDRSFSVHRAFAERVLVGMDATGRWSVLGLDIELACGLGTDALPAAWRPGQRIYAAQIQHLRLMAAS